MKVRWQGPTGFVNREVGAATGEGDVLVHDRVYDVPAKLADRLVASDIHWTKPAAKTKDDQAVKEAGDA